MNKIDIINTFPYDTQWEDFINWVYDKSKSDLLYETSFTGCIVSKFLNRKCQCGDKAHMTTEHGIAHEKGIEHLNKKQIALSALVTMKISDANFKNAGPTRYSRKDFIRYLKLGIKELKEKGVL